MFRIAEDGHWPESLDRLDLTEVVANLPDGEGEADNGDGPLDSRPAVNARRGDAGWEMKREGAHVLYRRVDDEEDGPDEEDEGVLPLPRPIDMRTLSDNVRSAVARNKAALRARQSRDELARQRAAQQQRGGLGRTDRRVLVANDDGDTLQPPDR